MSAVEKMIASVSEETIIAFCRERDNETFYRSQKVFERGEDNAVALFPTPYKDLFKSFSICGYSEKLNLFVFLIRLNAGKSLAERSCRRLQFDYAKYILKKDHGNYLFHDALTNWLHGSIPFEIARAIFVFADENGRFRFSLVENLDAKEESSKRFRRYTFYIDQNATNRTFEKRMEGKWASFEEVKKAFSVERLSDEFFEEYKKIYQSFVEYATGKQMVKQNGKWIEIQIRPARPEIMDQFDRFGDGEKAFRDYVKKMMGRLVFLQFLTKKGWLGVPAGEPWGNGDKEYMKNLFDSKTSAIQGDFLETVLEPLFFDSLNTDRTKSGDIAADELSIELGKKIRIPYLNGGLFEKDTLDGTKVKFPAKYFARSSEKEEEGIFDIFERFNFTIDENDPNDAEIGVDPEMLGRIFENLLEDNKDKGAFYTPKEIVSYMCQESLIQYLGESPEIRALVSDLDDSGIQDEQQKKDLIEKLKEVKICDPAIGSGAFPMGMLNLLYRLRIKLGDVEDSSKDILRAKKEIIQNNIYGVDIEPGAVDIARLRFWLSIVVDEDTPTPLPNFDYKIMQGNSLLESFMGVDLSRINPGEEIIEKRTRGRKSFIRNKVAIPQQKVFDLFEEGTTVQDIYDDMFKFFSESNHIKREEIRQRIHNNIITLICKSADNDGSITGEKRRQIKEAAKNLELKKAPFFLWHLYFGNVFANGGFDIVIGNPPYVLLQNIPDQSACAEYEALYRTATYKVDLYHLFFEKGINLLKKDGVMSFISSNTYLTNKHIKTLRDYILSTTSIISLLIYDDSVFESACVDVATILLKKTQIRDHSIQLKKYSSQGYKILQQAKQESWMNDPDKVFSMQQQTAFDLSKCVSLSQICKSYFGIQAHDKKASTSIRRENKYYLPIIDGGDFSRYTYAIPHHYYDFRPCTIKSGGKKEVYEQERIVIRQIGKYPIVGICKPGILASNTLYNIFLVNKDYDLLYVLGILNSRFMRYYWTMKYSDNKQLFPKIKGFQIDRLPIPIATKKQQASVATLVNRILSSKTSEEMSLHEKALDVFIYSLYNLGEKDIEIIEQSFDALSVNDTNSGIAEQNCSIESRDSLIQDDDDARG